MKIRSITIFDKISPELDADHMARLGAFATAARQAYEAAGYEVQTTRLAMDVFPALADSSWATRPVDFATALEALANAHGFAYIALGPAPREMLPHLPAIFAATQSIFATTHILDPTTGAIDGQAIQDAARVIQAAAQIEAGFGNLRFAALANVPAGTPFFPAAYADNAGLAFAIATESADLAVDACQEAEDAADAHRRLIDAIEADATRLSAVAQHLAQAHPARFSGIDFSLAPFPSPAISIGAALEAITGQPLGAAGTLTAAATLTDAIDRAQFPHTGFCGLMLPVLEDPILAQRAAEGRLHIGELLQWSAVCGTGLDTVPVPGDVDADALVRLLFDVAALSARLHKPLTARLMPLPGKVAGDPVHFDFAYFADGGVLALDGTGEPGKLAGTTELKLQRR